MGSLVHSRECGKATAVSVTSFQPGLVAKNGKSGSRRLNLPFLVLVAKYNFTVVEGAGTRTRFSKIGSIAHPCADSRNTRHFFFFF